MKTLTPKQKLIVAGCILLALPFAAAGAGASAAVAARIALVVAALAGAFLWAKRGGRNAETPERRLRVLQRAGLSGRCSLALVVADGREFLVAYGDGFAQIHPAPRQSAAGRRPSPRIRRHRAGGAR
jgi:hypothetical protein